MSELRDLYQEVILDHSKKPRNFREVDGAPSGALLLAQSIAAIHQPLLRNRRGGGNTSKTLVMGGKKK